VVRLRLLLVLSILFNSSVIMSEVLLAQSYLVHTYNENTGLPNSTVYDVVQDSSGRMWFATRNGIAVYDGTHWKSYSVADGLTITSFFRLQISESGKIWALGHIPGVTLTYFQGKFWYPITIPDSLVNISLFNTFLVTSTETEERIYLGTNEFGLLIYSQEKWRQLTPRNGLLGSRVNALVNWRKQVYVATDNGISIIRGDDIDNSFNDEIQLPSNAIVGLAVELNDSIQSDKLWIQGKDWIGFYQDKAFHLVAEHVKVQLYEANSYLILQPDYSGGLYFGNIYGVFHYDHESNLIKPLDRGTGLISEGTTALYLDRESNLWIACLRGVSKIASRRFVNYRKANGLLEDEVTAILEIEPNKLVFGHKNGLTFLDGNQKKIIIFDKEDYVSDAETRVLDLRLDGQKNVWVAASNLGLARIDPAGKLQWYREESGLNGSVTSVFFDSFERIWVTDDYGLHLYKKDGFQNLKFGHLPATGFRRIYPGPNNSLYIATRGEGIYVYQDNQWSQYSNPGEPNTNSVYTIQFTTTGQILAGCLGGLYELKDRRLVKFVSNGFQIDRPIYLSIKDREKRLWFGTDNGVIRWDGKDWREYTPQQGLAGQETNRAAGIVDSKGQVWIGTDLGVSCYQKEFDYDQAKIPPPIVYLDSLLVSGKGYSFDEPIGLSYSDNDLTFYFTAISFIDENALQYRYKLTGYDSDWVTLGQKFIQPVRYTNLSPGTYQFHLQVQNSLGFWSPIIKSKEITIQQPFWKTSWFIILIASFVIIGLILFYKIRISVLKREQRVQRVFAKKLMEAVDQERRRIAAELHDSIGQDLMAIRNGVQLSLKSLSYPSELAQKLNEISTIARDAINEVREISYNLHPHHLDRLGLTRAIEANIHQTTKSAGIVVKTRIDNINDLFFKEQEIHVFRIVQEGLNNILKHAAASEARIEIKKTTQMIYIIIQDNGNGFDYRAYRQKQLEREGIGLNGINERVTILKGKVSIKSALSKGTTLKIELPIRHRQNETTH